MTVLFLIVKSTYNIKKQSVNVNRKEIDLEILKLKSGRSSADADLIEEYFRKLDDRIGLYSFRKRQMLQDFLKAFDRYLDEGKDVKDICELIDPCHLGSFYQDDSREDYDLDNAAIVYPLGMRYGRMPMFRMSVTLKHDIDPVLLQIAMYFTAKRFPVFQTAVKTGFFWHYLETTHDLPLIEEEKDVPCKPISIILRSNRSYRVFYFKKRISIEFFHVLTDGSGALIFLKTLTAEYLRLSGFERVCGEGVLDIDGEIDEEELLNGFERAEGEDDIGTFLDRSSLQLDGKLSAVRPHHIIHYDMDLSELKTVSKKYDVTITAFLLAVMFMSARKAIKKEKGIFNIQVPVNMRKFNGSRTLRNYSMYFSATEEIGNLMAFKDLVKDINEQIKEKGSEKVMNRMMKATGKLIRMVAPIPLFLKNPVVQIAYGYLGNSIIGSVLSNIGAVRVPEEIKDEIDHFDFLLVPDEPNRVSCTLVSYRDRIRFSVISATEEKRFEEEIYRLLEEEGISIKLEGSIDYGA